MESKRQLQVAEMVRRHIGTLLQQEGPYIYGAEVLVTVTNVKMSPDMGLAKIYLSVYNTENKQAVILQMEDQHFRIRQAFSQRVKKKMRRVPELQFFIDDTLDEMYRLNELFNQLDHDKQKGKASSDDQTSS